MYWSYLTNTQSSSQISSNINNILTFECNDDLIKLTNGYCELVLSEFFTSFDRDYDAIFISEYGPTENPLDKEKKFIINFSDNNKALNILKKIENKFE